MTTLGTTRPFAPPEKVLDRRFSAASDVYSLGVTMFVAITGSLKLFDDIGTEFLHKVAVNPAEKVQEYFQQSQPVVCTCSDDLRSLIIHMVDLDYKNRPTAAAVVESLEKMLKRSVKKASLKKQIQ